MANFELNDASAKRWSFAVTLRRMPDEEGIYILTVNGFNSPSIDPEPAMQFRFDANQEFQQRAIASVVIVF